MTTQKINMLCAEKLGITLQEPGLLSGIRLNYTTL